MTGELFFFLFLQNATFVAFQHLPTIYNESGWWAGEVLTAQESEATVRGRHVFLCRQSCLPLSSHRTIIEENTWHSLTRSKRYATV